MGTTFIRLQNYERERKVQIKKERKYQLKIGRKDIFS